MSDHRSHARPATRTRGIRLIGVLALTLGFALTASHASAATVFNFTVNTSADTHDASTGDGVCADSTGKCSLRAAIEEGNADGDSSTINIRVPAGSYNLSLGELDITGGIFHITGAGSTTTTVNGSGNPTTGNDSVFYNDAVTTIQGLKITGGLGATRYDTPTDPAGGGVYNDYSLTLSSDLITGNGGVYDETYYTGSYYGGGFYNDGQATLTNTTITSNTSEYGGGIGNDNHLTIYGGCICNNIAYATKGGAPDYGEGGGIDNYGYAQLTGVQVNNNVAGGLTRNGALTNEGTEAVGGGIYSGSELDYNIHITGGSVSGNTAANDGGGIYNYDQLALTGTAVSNNVAGESAGGIDTEYYSYITSSSITHNTAGGALSGEAGYGGGTYNYKGYEYITSSTVSYNSTPGTSGTLLRLNLRPSTVHPAAVVANHPAPRQSPKAPLKKVLVHHTAVSQVRTNLSATSDGDGGGIYIDSGSEFLTGDTFLANSSYYGGGIYESDGVLQVTRTRMLANFAVRGGAIYMDDYDDPTNITGSTIIGNFATDTAGGIENFDYTGLNVSGSLIAGNHAPTCSNIKVPCS